MKSKCWTDVSLLQTLKTLSVVVILSLYNDTGTHMRHTQSHSCLQNKKTHIKSRVHFDFDDVLNVGHYCTRTQVFSGVRYKTLKGFFLVLHMNRAKLKGIHKQQWSKATQPRPMLWVHVKNFNQPHWHCNLPLLCPQCNYLTTIMSLI